MTSSYDVIIFPPDSDTDVYWTPWRKTLSDKTLRIRQNLVENILRVFAYYLVGMYFWHEPDAYSDV